MIKAWMALIIFISFCILNPATAETQASLNQAACDALKKADTTLNKVYQQILVKYDDDDKFISNLVDAQKKWIAFRDAYVASMYLPGEEDSYGSILPMCQCYFIEGITQDRIKQLRVWLDGIDEGDVCIGTVK